MFSPYYAWTGWKDPFDHCAINVALYQPGRQSWSMTERRRGALRQEREALVVGRSAMRWVGGALEIDVHEVGAPIPQRLRGHIRLHPTAMLGETFAIDDAGRHLWRPIAPRAEVEVSFGEPACAWRGQGYFDTNAGVEPLQEGFSTWNWSRAHGRTDTFLFYDVERRDGCRADLALRIGAGGAAERIASPPAHDQPLPLWRMPRAVRGDADRPPVLRRTLEDAPFYSRTALDGVVAGEAVQIVHESVSLDRLRSPLVRAMLPFRMPRTLW